MLALRLSVSHTLARTQTSRAAPAAALLSTLALTTAAGAAIPSYVPAGSFAAPGNSSVYDVLPDGRLIAVDAAGQIVQQSGVNASTYAAIGSLPSGTLPTFGAGFARLSPSGTTLAIGDNGAADRIYTVSVAALSTSGPTAPAIIASPNYDATWTSETDLYVSGSPSNGSATPGVYRVSTTPASSTRVVANIGDGSGGIAAINGRLYTGLGFDLSFSRAGETRSFLLSTLDTAVSPLDFSAGALLGTHNTASSMAVDAQGNLVIAGFGGVSVVDVQTGTSYVLPGLSTLGFYSAHFNAATGEILVRDFGAPSILRFAVPSPAGAGLLGLAGLVAIRRRR